VHARAGLRRLRATLGSGARNAPADDGEFGGEVYSNIRVGCQRSAAVVAPAVQEIVGATSVIDVGGGEGWWAAAFAELGARAVSIDTGSLDHPAAGVEHVRYDLRRGLPTGLGTFDLALCLEVAEHLDQEAGDRLVAGLCELAPVVLFSAAVPGQGGHGHLNEQWPAYWVERFSSFGFQCSGALRWRFWRDEGVEEWYRQNLLFAAREPSRFPELFQTPLAEPWAVVHPETFARASP
jgi:hypothetical protein